MSSLDARCVLVAGGHGGLSGVRAAAALAVVLVWPAALALAQMPAGQQTGSVPGEAAVERAQPFIYFLFGGGGLTGVLCTTPILVMSVIALALMFQNLLTIRRSVLVPPGLAEDLHDLVSGGNLAGAESRCKEYPSLLSEVVLAGLRQVRLGYAAIEKAMEDACHGQAARLFRKIEFLSVVANISVMLGLFGTVVGLVIAFKRLADTEGVARAADLASGIYLAM
ncbi:MAG TPA: MotA/TolQ/ExbB proton channel family protein, partial [Planctomycetaceae bacterium]|nr:MotA/TolQ/ExbB proton channel family protein [Planctomycetaceae bacterium]